MKEQIQAVFDMAITKVLTHYLGEKPTEEQEYAVVLENMPDGSKAFIYEGKTLAKITLSFGENISNLNFNVSLLIPPQ